jgi:hypothetical protein
MGTMFAVSLIMILSVICGTSNIARVQANDFGTLVITLDDPAYYASSRYRRGWYYDTTGCYTDVLIDINTIFPSTPVVIQISCPSLDNTVVIESDDNTVKTMSYVHVDGVLIITFQMGDRVASSHVILNYRASGIVSESSDITRNMITIQSTINIPINETTITRSIKQSLVRDITTIIPYYNGMVSVVGTDYNIYSTYYNTPANQTCKYGVELPHIYDLCRLRTSDKVLMGIFIPMGIIMVSAMICTHRHRMKVNDARRRRLERVVSQTDTNITRNSGLRSTTISDPYPSPIPKNAIIPQEIQMTITTNRGSNGISKTSGLEIKL